MLVKHFNFLNCDISTNLAPNRNLPIAILSGTMLVTIVYILTNIAYFVALNSEEIIASASIAASFAAKLNLSFIWWITPIAVAFSTIGGLNGTIFVSSRLMSIGAEEKQIPAIFGMISLKNGTPQAALVTTCVIATLTILTGSVFQLINYFSFTVWFWTGISTASQVYLRYKRPNLKRPTKVNIALPIVFSTLCFLITIVSIYASPWNAAIGISIILTGIPFFFVQKKVKRTNIAWQCNIPIITCISTFSFPN
ncbi:Y+LAT1B-like protein [Leptotrombidium deliense]|uniref:Y+LAT1B-like protein n=1 Tax=Leptotrombidium deliense TaxID=299467 RepID=A0A443SQN8_9ACAR|nr:Y+LAT1B-like protein [Leptotrombidium deliense]